MSVKGNTRTGESIKGTINTIPEIIVPTKLEDMPDKCENIKGTINEVET